jgi:hypothetical protein
MKEAIKVFSIMKCNIYIESLNGIIINFIALIDPHDSQIVDLEISNSMQLEGTVIVIYYHILK